MASTTITKRKSAAPAAERPLLVPGERLDQATFHARYEAMPAGVRAELIGGVVYMSSPMKRRHGAHHGELICAAFQYKRATPGVEAYDNASTLLGPDSEPQPDACLLIAPECGGQTRVVDDYIAGAPEWLGEISDATEAIDLHAKKADYERAGVKEYVVVALRQARVYYFQLQDGRFTELAAGPDGVFHSNVMPGLWLDGDALLTADGARLDSALRQGLASPEHQAFVELLRANAKSAR